MISAVNNEKTGTCREQGVRLALHWSIGSQVAERQQLKHEQFLWKEQFVQLCECVSLIKGSLLGYELL